MNTRLTRTRLSTAAGEQQGAITLAMSLILLFLITLVSLSVSRTVSIEQKVANNDVRARQAFEAAEAGIAAAFDYLDNNPPRNNASNVLLAVDPPEAGYFYDAVEVTEPPSKRIVTETGSATVRFYDPGADPSVDDPVEALSAATGMIVSTGTSDDETATRTITVTASQAESLGFVPANPLTARGQVIIDGSATIRNPEGDSTLWSGEEIDLGSNNTTATEIADPYYEGDPTADPPRLPYPSCMDFSLACGTIRSSNKLTVGPDIVDNDTTLGNMDINELFEKFFGMTMAQYRSSVVTLETTAETANVDVQHALNEVIWIEGDTTFVFNTTIGCKETPPSNRPCDVDAGDLQPSIVIINGDLTTTGNPHFSGLVIVTGSIVVSGNTDLYGALIAGGTVTNNTGGSLDITYHSDALNRTRQIGPFSAAAGSWRDF
ncbi:MAG: pilus assembly PilX N-terminal domain-containing protein [Gammaproteobacteria bacterium]|jgi:hypothetical protein